MKYSILFACLFLSACIVQPATVDVSSNSGVEGQSLIGPMCPVMRIDQPCPDEPYETMLIIQDANGNDLQEIQTDAEGKFRAALPPGDYILHPLTPDDMPLPYAGDVAFTVFENQFTQLVINYDSGIR
jgi:hypothetical protein